MKTILLFSSLSLLALGSMVSVAAHCPQQQVLGKDNICIRPEAYIQGCEFYLNSQQCASCSQDYDLNQGKCLLRRQTLIKIQVHHPMEGCLDGDASVCNNCANGYRRVEGVCARGVKFCEQYNKKGNCMRCNKQYSLMFNQCKHNKMLGCRIQQSSHSCLQCHKPFLLQTSICTISNCKSYNDFGCITCQCGYFLTNARTCQQMSNGCLKYYRGACVQCLPHYQIKGGVCAIEGCMDILDHLCTVCKQEYELVEGTCRFRNCRDWKDDTCLICEDGYRLVKGKCQPAGKPFVCQG